MPTIQAAVIGSGFIGPVHVEGLRRAGIHVVGILDADPQRTREAATRLDVPKAYASLDELLTDSDVHSVHIAVPNRFHYEMAAKALASGKHVMCEKPLAMDSRESAELVELARRSGRRRESTTTSATIPSVWRRPSGLATVGWARCFTSPAATSRTGCFTIRTSIGAYWRRKVDRCGPWPISEPIGWI